MKIGDTVQHKKYQWLGKVQDIYTDLWFVGTGEKTEALVRVKWYDVSKKYHGLYDKEALAPYSPTPVEDTTVFDWLATTKEKDRTALAKKHDKIRKNALAKGRIRLDGRRK